MRKEIRQVSKDGKIVQVTVADTERWYLEEDEKEISSYPSVTWISSYYPKGKYLDEWIDKVGGLAEAEKIKKAAGIRGHKVHQLITILLNGKTVAMDDTVPNPDTGEEEEITLEEYEYLLSFAKWFEEVKPEVLANEIVTINREVGYAGTIDLICKINDEEWMIDFKRNC